MNRVKIASVERFAWHVQQLCQSALRELDERESDTYIAGTKTSGALRRASMELTRALAEMRKP